MAAAGAAATGTSAAGAAAAGAAAAGASAALRGRRNRHELARRKVKDVTRRSPAPSPAVLALSPPGLALSGRGVSASPRGVAALAPRLRCAMVSRLPLAACLQRSPVRCTTACALFRASTRCSQSPESSPKRIRWAWPSIRRRSVEVPSLQPPKTSTDTSCSGALWVTSKQPGAAPRLLPRRRRSEQSHSRSSARFPWLKLPRTLPAAAWLKLRESALRESDDRLLKLPPARSRSALTSHSKRSALPRTARQGGCRQGQRLWRGWERERPMKVAVLLPLPRRGRVEEGRASDHTVGAPGRGQRHVTRCSRGAEGQGEANTRAAGEAGRARRTCLAPRA